MKYYTILLIVWIAFFMGCASLKGNVSVDSKTDKQTEKKTDTDSSFGEIHLIDQHIQENRNYFDHFNNDRNFYTKTIEEYGTYKEPGGSDVKGHTGDGATSIWQTVRRGRITATGMYFYKNDSISVKLVVRDTTFSINRKITTSQDLSKIESESSLNTAKKVLYDSSSSDNTKISRSSDTKVSKKADVAVKASFSTAIGISNWWPVIIALIIGLSAGIPLGRKSKA